MTKQKIEGFKAFDTNKEGKMSCRNFVYEENHSYVYNGEIRPCESGFHFCKSPLDVLNYYSVIDDNMNIRSAFAKVKGSGEIAEEGNKYCCSKIKIGEKLGFSDFILEAIKAILKACKTESSIGYPLQLASNINKSQLASNGDCSRLASSGNESQLASNGNGSSLSASGDESKLVSSGDDSQLASSGNYSQLASSGYNSKLASTGYYSQLASSGDDSKLASIGDLSRLASSGDFSRLTSSGDNSKLASSGDRSRLVSSGDFSQLESSGDNSKLASSGDDSKLASSGDNCIIAGIGYKNIVKGKVGSWIVLAEYDNGHPRRIKSVKTALIDGKKIKADTFYKLKNGRFVETEA